MTAALRPARPDEAAALTGLVMRSKAHWGYSADFLARCRPALTVTRTALARRPNRVATRDGRPVGFAMIACAAPTAELLLLFVEPAEIGRGVGRTLFAWALAAARAAGATTLRIESDPHAVPFYEAMGARVVGRAPSEADPGRRIPVFERALGGPA